LIKRRMAPLKGRQHREARGRSKKVHSFVIIQRDRVFLRGKKELAWNRLLEVPFSLARGILPWEGTPDPKDNPFGLTCLGLMTRGKGKRARKRLTVTWADRKKDHVWGKGVWREGKGRTP